MKAVYAFASIPLLCGVSLLAMADDTQNVIINQLHSADVSSASAAIPVPFTNGKAEDQHTAAPPAQQPTHYASLYDWYKARHGKQDKQPKQKPLPTKQVLSDKAASGTHNALAENKPVVITNSQTTAGAELKSKQPVNTLSTQKSVQPDANSISADTADQISTQILGQLTDVKPKPKKPTYHYQFHDGSLHSNVQAFASHYHYKLLWHVVDADNGQFADFQHVGDEAIKADSVPKILQQVMQPYDVQVKVWQANKVFCVTTDGQCE